MKDFCHECGKLEEEDILVCKVQCVNEGDSIERTLKYHGSCLQEQTIGLKKKIIDMTRELNYDTMLNAYTQTFSNLRANYWEC